MTSTTTMISTAAELEHMISSLKDLPQSLSSLYIDLEGANLSRHGSISLITLLKAPTSTVYLIDIHTLGATAFTTKGTAGITLKSILESPTISKVIFDLRNDSDALFAHYTIKLACVHDLQLMELATRNNRPRTFVSGLANCIKYEVPLTIAQKRDWEKIKTDGTKLYAPEKGGRYEVFNERPLNAVIEKYCMQDVLHMPSLWKTYDKKLNAFWREMVRKGSDERVRESQSKGYQPHGSHKARGHWSGSDIARKQKEWNKRIRK